jgi:hypothetical protein
METKRCADCKQVKPITEFAQRIKPRVGFHSYCRDCRNARNRAYGAKKVDQNRLRNIAYRRRLRRETLAAYGGQCACCGEHREEFLALDHVNGGGSKERKNLANNTPSGIYRIARDAGYPKDRYRVLCHNCNNAIGWYGYCPHERERGL